MKKNQLKFLIFAAIFIFMACARVDLKSEASVVEYYIYAHIDGDIKMMSLLETGSDKIFEETFGILADPVSERIKNNRKQDRSDFQWIILKIDRKKNLSEVKLRVITPDSDKIVDRAQKYLGYKYNEEGRLVSGEPIKPGLTFTEAAKMARADPDIKPLEYNVTITLEKTANGWIVLPMQSKGFMRIFYPFDMKYEEK
jgi:hypothetical protein